MKAPFETRVITAVVTTEENQRALLTILDACMVLAVKSADDELAAAIDNINILVDG